MDEMRRAVLGDLACVLERLRDLGIDWLPFAAPRLEPPRAAAPGFAAPAATGPAPPRRSRAPLEAERKMARSAGQRSAPAASSGRRRPAEAVAVQALEREIRDCGQCALRRDRPPVIGEGATNADILFVAGWPREEAAGGQVWTGAVRELFGRMLAAVKLDLAAVYSTFAVKCPPPAAGPSAEEARACLACLERQVAVLQPRLLVAVGADAARLLSGSQQSIFQLRRGQHRFAGRPLYILHHPDFLIRHEETLEFRRQAWEDLKRIRSTLDRLRRQEG